MLRIAIFILFRIKLSYPAILYYNVFNYPFIHNLLTLQDFSIAALLSQDCEEEKRRPVSPQPPPTSSRKRKKLDVDEEDIPNTAKSSKTSHPSEESLSLSLPHSISTEVCAGFCLANHMHTISYSGNNIVITSHWHFPLYFYLLVLYFYVFSIIGCASCT